MLNSASEVAYSAPSKKPFLSKREKEKEIIYSRAGKWTHEEETFATKLMDEFEAGRLPDIPMKLTLRKLLAQKLQCNKMRISKKFGGRCYGKVIWNYFYSIYLLLDIVMRLITPRTGSIQVLQGSEQPHGQRCHRYGGVGEAGVRVLDVHPRAPPSLSSE